MKPKGKKGVADGEVSVGVPVTVGVVVAVSVAAGISVAASVAGAMSVAIGVSVGLSVAAGVPVIVGAPGTVTTGVVLLKAKLASAVEFSGVTRVCVTLTLQAPATIMIAIQID